MNISAARKALAAVAATGVAGPGAYYVLPADIRGWVIGAAPFLAGVATWWVKNRGTVVAEVRSIEATGLIPSAFEAKLDKVLDLLTPPPAPVGPPDPLLDDALAIIRQGVPT